MQASLHYVEYAFNLFHSLGARSIAIVDDTPDYMCDVSETKSFSIKYNMTYQYVSLSDVTTNFSTFEKMLLEFKNQSVGTILGCTYASALATQVLPSYIRDVSCVRCAVYSNSSQNKLTIILLL